MSEQAKLTKQEVADMLRGIDRYNPNNVEPLEKYVVQQARENDYDLEANLAILKLYQFNGSDFNPEIVMTILLKSLTNLPHNDFVLCQCLIDSNKIEEEPILKKLIHLHDALETCRFPEAWTLMIEDPEICKLIGSIKGFEESIRKFVIGVISITYQTISKDVLRSLLGSLGDKQLKDVMTKQGWKDSNDGYVFIANQEENIKTKNITENIEFGTVAPVLASYRAI